MAVTRINYQDTLRMRFDLGPDPEEPTSRIRRARSYTRGRHNTSDANFFNLAQGFARLFDAELVNAYRVMHVELVDDGGS